MDFGLLVTSSKNLGDDIQALAARQFLPRIDRYIQREALKSDPGGTAPTRLIMNGWYTNNARAWPPHPQISPLVTSVHVHQHRAYRWQLWEQAPSRRMLSGHGLQWFLRQEPIGARDQATRALLQAHGIASFYSGCLTLTIVPRPWVEDTNRIVACDLPDYMVAALVRRTGEEPIIATHAIKRTLDFEERLRRADAMLDIYAGAKAVVTTRLHCALPCLALGTPVLFMPVLPDLYRQEPGLELAHNCTFADFLAGRDGFDLRNPPANPARHVALADALIGQARTFVGGEPGLAVTG